MNMPQTPETHCFHWRMPLPFPSAEKDLQTFRIPSTVVSAIWKESGMKIQFIASSYNNLKILSFVDKNDKPIDLNDFIEKYDDVNELLTVSVTKSTEVMEKSNNESKESFILDI